MKLCEVAKSVKLDRLDVEDWLSARHITHYTIQDNGVVDVFDSVLISDMNMTVLPIQFGNVTGDFNCSHTKLANLKGCPQKVGGDFVCRSNYLTSLIGSPRLVNRHFDCSYTKIRSLAGLPYYITGDFDCYGCTQLTDMLKHIFNPKFTLVGTFFTPDTSLDDIINEHLSDHDLMGCVEQICQLNSSELFKYCGLK